MLQNILEQTARHPCYSADACHKYARMHLPVAPRCNVQCNYCNRKFDCVNESRPGVTSEVLTPDMAKKKFVWVKKRIPELSVVGIAGPGDALAEWEATKETIQKIKEIDEQITFCLSTNGLLLPKYADEIVELGVHHVTVTVNALKPELSAQIYQYVQVQGKKYTGISAAQLLLENQLQGIAYLVKHSVLVKVNIVMIKGINDKHIPDVVKKVKELGAFVTNIMPLIPAVGSAFEKFPQTSMKEVNALRNLCQQELQQMWHCQQCRADAVGLLNDDRSQEFRLCPCSSRAAQGKLVPPKQYRIAVTSKYGKLVDQHFGHARQFTIYQSDGQTVENIEKRTVETQYCAGMAVCGDDEAVRGQVMDTLQDCDAVLTMRIGQHAKEELQQRGIYCVEFCDTVASGLQHVVNQLAAQAVSAGNL